MVTLSDRTWKVIDPLNEENMIKVKTTHNEITEIEVSPDGKFVLTGGTEGDVVLWKIRTLGMI
jgi:WD40 repeat protein